MSDNIENNVVETVAETVVESTSKSNKELYIIGAGLFALAACVGVKKCYEYMKKKNNE
jgi:hypothetical protein